MVVCNDDRPVGRVYFYVPTSEILGHHRGGEDCARGTARRSTYIKQRHSVCEGGVRFYLCVFDAYLLCGGVGYQR